MNGKSIQQLHSYDELKDVVLKAFHLVYYGDDNQHGLRGYVESESSEQIHRVVVMELVCMKYFLSMFKLMQNHVNWQMKKPNGNKCCLFIESGSFIRGMSDFFNVTIAHLKRCDAIRKGTGKQFELKGAGGGGMQISCAMYLSMVDSNSAAAKYIPIMGSVIKLIFYEFSVFLMQRYPKNCENS